MRGGDFVVLGFRDGDHVVDAAGTALGKRPDVMHLVAFGEFVVAKLREELRLYGGIAHGVLSILVLGCRVLPRVDEGLQV